MRTKENKGKTVGIVQRMLSLTMALIVILGSIVPMVVSAEETTTTDNSLYAKMDFEDPVDGVFTTKGANQKTYTLIGSALHNPRGISGYGVSMTQQVSGCAITENVDYTFNNGHSISIWLRGDVISSGWTGAIIAKGAKTTGHFEIVVKDKVFHIYAPDVGTVSLGLNCSEITDGWHHIAFVWESNVIKSYVDGVLKATSATINGSVVQTSNPISIGAVNDKSLAFTGIIDEVELYTKALSASEVVSIYNTQTVPKEIELVGTSEVGDIIESSDFCLADETAVQFWFNAKTFTQNTAFETLFSKGVKNAKGYFQLYTRNGNLEFHAINEDETPSALSNTGYMKVTLSEFTGGWHMFTIVNKDSQFLVYVDDTLISAVDSSSYKPYAATANITVGALEAAVFTGNIQKFALLTTAPDAAGVKAEYDRVVASVKEATLADSIYAEMDFEDPVDGVFTTKGTNQKTYTITGSAIHTSRGIEGYGLGTNLQSVGNATTEAMDYTFNNGHSIAMWIHGDMLVPGTKARPNVLLAKGPKESGHFEFYVKGSGGNVVYMYAPGVGDISLNLGITELHGDWHHLAFVWDGNVIKSYVDGVLKATSATITGTIEKTTKPIYVGNFDNSTDPFFNGTIDEVQFYTKALSVEEIGIIASAIKVPDKIELSDINEVGDVIHSSEFCLSDGTAVRFWFNASTFTKNQKSSDIFETLFSKGTKNAKGYFQFYTRNGLLEFHAVNEDGSSSALSNANYMKVTLSEFTGGWHMFTIVNKDSQFLVYVDDTLISTVDSSSYKPYATAADITVGALGTAVFSGKIQNFELLDTAPSAADVKAEYDNVINGHKHVFNQEKVEEKFICSTATYTTPAKYYMSCTCGQIGEETFDGDLKPIATAGSNLTVGKDLTMNFYLPSDITSDIKLRVTMNGESAILDGEESNGLYKFSYKGIAPQCMGDDITVEIVVVNGENVVTNVLAIENGHGITSYFAKLLSKTYTELGITEEKYAVMKTLIADILNYGTAAQIYKDYKTDTLVNANVTGGTEFKALTTTDMSIKGTAIEGVSFYSATVYYNNTNKLYFRIKAEDTTGLCAVIKRGDKIEKIIEASDFIVGTDEGGETVYSIYSNDIYATDFDATFTVTLYRQTNSDSVEGQTLTYSVNSYAYSKQNDGGETLSSTAKLARAMYCYGASSDIYSSMN